MELPHGIDDDARDGDSHSHVHAEWCDRECVSAVHGFVSRAQTRSSFQGEWRQWLTAP
jgi:hypothetical protein